MADKSSDVEPYRFRAPLTVCVDVAHPECWLTIAPAEALAAELQITVEWLPFPMALPETPGEPPPGTAESRGARHRRVRARYRQADLERYAAVRGLHLRAPFPRFDSALASLGLLWLAEHAPERAAAYLQRVCSAYFGGPRGVTDEQVVAQALQAVESDASGFTEFAAGAGPRQLARLREALVAAGVFTVPTLIVDGEPYVGRAHLPMVRWVLTGREGRPTI